MEIIGRWWNGVWGKLARRDIWLGRQTRWHVVARSGDAETGRVLRWDFTTEAEARAMVKRLTSPVGPGQWREQEKGGPAPEPPDTPTR